jgi:hypothetical protein
VAETLTDVWLRGMVSAVKATPTVGAAEHMVTLNRSAVVIIPKQPFLDWLHAADPTSRELTLQVLAREPAVYLVQECDTDEDVGSVLRELCEEIFIQQLAGWFSDTMTWPRDRSFDIFCRWFDYRHHSMLIDLCDEPLIRDRD